MKANLITDKEKQTLFTKENLDRLWNAIEYTYGTIPRFPENAKEKPGWCLIHTGRAENSVNFLADAKKSH